MQKSDGNEILYEKIKSHIGHWLVCVQYGDGEKVAIKCTDCYEVIVDCNRPKEVKSGHKRD